MVSLCGATKEAARISGLSRSLLKKQFAMQTRRVCFANIALRKTFNIFGIVLNGDWIVYLYRFLIDTFWVVKRANLFCWNDVKDASTVPSQWDVLNCISLQIGILLITKEKYISLNVHSLNSKKIPHS
jgi:hypothetical protein